MITFYDFVTTVVMLSLFLLWTISIIVLFKKEMSTLSALMWLAVIIILPILGPIAFESVRFFVCGGLVYK